MAIEDTRQRLLRTSRALDEAGVPYAVIGGFAVQSWVSTRDPDAIRFTKDVDMLLRREDLERAKAALARVDLHYDEVSGVGMFMESEDPSPKRAVRLIWADEKVRANDALPAPPVERRTRMPEGYQVIELLELIRMKLVANRRHDQVHLQDMIEVGLIDRSMLAPLPPELAARLEPLLAELGR